MAKIIGEGLSFDDVLLVPKYSELESRSEVNLETRFTRKIKLYIPIVSAAMDTVTESSMAIALARAGGIGVIHRFMTINSQVKEVAKVKRSEGLVIEKPYTIEPKIPVSHASEYMDRLGVSGLVVIDYDGRVLGIVTRRDLMFADPNDLVEDVMTSRKDLVVLDEGRNIKDAWELMKQHKLEKIPIVDKEGRLKGLVTAKDILKRKIGGSSTLDSKGRLAVAAAIGVRGDWLERAMALYSVEVDSLVIDVAHAHTRRVIEVLKKLKNEFGDEVQIVAGNIATPEAAEDLISAGADALKVGIGPGYVCTTRIVTGVGVPQLTAVMNIAEVSKLYDIPIIADGGIRSSGDIVKALAAGASTVMLGYMLAGTDEAPGRIVVVNGVKSKLYRGMASVQAYINRVSIDGEDPYDLSYYASEGVETYIPYKGSVVDIIKNIVNGIKSGFSYVGARNLKELWENATFIKIAGGAFKETYSKPVKGLQ